MPRRQQLAEIGKPRGVRLPSQEVPVEPAHEPLLGRREPVHVREDQPSHPARGAGVQRRSAEPDVIVRTHHDADRCRVGADPAGELRDLPRLDVQPPDPVVQELREPDVARIRAHRQEDQRVPVLGREARDSELPHLFRAWVVAPDPPGVRQDHIDVAVGTEKGVVGAAARREVD